ncbi:hypothetical protein [Vibrio diazotrophicus]|uniref:hypothetical protein n=1 Tax=Vibrio diazotrophicus TaxID=685 RepID=UPI00142D2C59|nr:hypothetical protein [Vibrio diazotrophicus]NIY91482.1 hypothetical protein [Vibrio diazotrophicus]
MPNAKADRSTIVLNQTIVQKTINNASDRKTVIAIEFAQPAGTKKGAKAPFHLDFPIAY